MKKMNQSGNAVEASKKQVRFWTASKGRPLGIDRREGSMHPVKKFLLVTYWGLG